MKKNNSISNDNNNSNSKLQNLHFKICNLNS